MDMVYCTSDQVTVSSDHQALRWLMSLKSPIGRLARWVLALQLYNLKVTYTPGKANVLADTLSRPNCDGDHPSCAICVLCSRPTDTGIEGDERLTIIGSRSSKNNKKF